MATVASLKKELAAELKRAEAGHLDEPLNQAVEQLLHLVDSLEAWSREHGGEDTAELARVKSAIKEAEKALTRALSHHAVVSESHAAHKENLRAENLTLEHWESWEDIVDATEAKAGQIKLSPEDIKTVKKKLKEISSALEQLKGVESKEVGHLRQYEEFQKAAEQLSAYLAELKAATGGQSIHEKLARALGNWKQK